MYSVHLCSRYVCQCGREVGVVGMSVWYREVSVVGMSVWSREVSCGRVPVW